MLRATSADPLTRRGRVFWWKEALIAVVFWVGYSWARAQIGSNRVGPDVAPEQAFRNAESVIRFERFLGLYHEESIQDLFLAHRRFIEFWNVFYSTTLFILSFSAFVLLFVKRADVFVPWRNSLWAMNALAIVGFACFPLMPPRLLDAPCPEAGSIHFGGACIESELRPGQYDGENGFGFVDTLNDYGGFWKFDSEKVASISNQYAALPSMHIGWAMWCAVAMWPLLRRRWAKVAVLLYPAVTFFCIVVTANHYWIDGVGGLAAFGGGAAIGWGMHVWNQRRLDRVHSPSVHVDSDNLPGDTSRPLASDDHSLVMSGAPASSAPARRESSSSGEDVWHC